MTTQCFVGHAMHPDWRAALALAAAQVDGQRARQRGGEAPAPPTLGLVYFSDRYAGEAEALHAALRERWPGVAWAGTVGVGICAGGVEYFDEPALVLMLATLPAGQFRVFSGARPLPQAELPASALVHADANTHDLAELLADLAARTATGYLFGGLGSSRTRVCHVADGVYEGGLSGVAFTREVGLVSRVTQGSQPVGPTRRITACERNVVTELDGQPALECLLADLDLALDRPEARSRVIATLRGTLVGLASPHAPLPAQAGTAAGTLPRHRAFGDDVRVRHLIGLDPGRHGVAVAELVEPGMTLAFCQRDVAAARRDLIRICAEIRDELVPEPLLAAAAGAAAPAEEGPILDPATHIAGAIYVSCAGRGGPHFGAPSAELQIVRHALGDVPLVGFFAAGEIGHQQLYGYTGVLTVLTRE